MPRRMKELMVGLKEEDFKVRFVLSKVSLVMIVTFKFYLTRKK